MARLFTKVRYSTENRAAVIVSFVPWTLMTNPSWSTQESGDTSCFAPLPALFCSLVVFFLGFSTLLQPLSESRPHPGAWPDYIGQQLTEACLTVDNISLPPVVNSAALQGTPCHHRNPKWLSASSWFSEHNTLYSYHSWLKTNCRRSWPWQGRHLPS